MTRADRLISIITTLVVTSSSARAQSAEAEVLFRDGRTLIKQGKLADGCAKIEASERLETSVGTLLNLGDCRERLGKLVGAWAAFRKAEGLAKNAATDDKRADEARRRALALEPNLPTLTLELAVPISGLVIKRDGELIDAALIGTPIPLDPGVYVLSAEAPGRRAWRSDVVVQYKSRRRIQVPNLALVPMRAPVVATSTEPARTAPPRAVRRSVALTEAPRHVVPVMVRHERSVWTGWRKFSVVLGVAGVAAAGTGLYFGMHANELERDADRRCPLPVCNDPVALRDNEEARTSATRANVLYIAGGVAVGSAVALWLVSGPSERTVVTPVISGDGAGAALAGTF